MERYDIAVIGTGPAGLEAAITAKIRNKSILLLGNNKLSEKIEKAHTIKNYLGLCEISGEKMQQAFSDHLKSLEIEITQDKVNTVYAMGDYFAIQGHGDMYEAKSVILACGMSVSKPFVGELENLGRGVSYCATCDGSLYRDRQAVVIGYSPEEENEANYLSEIAKEVIYIAMYDEIKSLSEKVTVIKDEKPVEIVKKPVSDNPMGRMVLTTDKRTIETDGIFILRESVAPSQLVPGLNIENNQVEVDRKMRTNIEGLFACGDITGAPYQYIKAAGEGNVAALSAVNYLSNNNN